MTVKSCRDYLKKFKFTISIGYYTPFVIRKGNLRCIPSAETYELMQKFIAKYEDYDDDYKIGAIKCKELDERVVNPSETNINAYDIGRLLKGVKCECDDKLRFESRRMIVNNNYVEMRPSMMINYDAHMASKILENYEKMNYSINYFRVNSLCFKYNCIIQLRDGHIVDGNVVYRLDSIANHEVISKCFIQKKNKRENIKCYKKWL